MMSDTRSAPLGAAQRLQRRQRDGHHALLARRVEEARGADDRHAPLARVRPQLRIEAGRDLQRVADRARARRAGTARSPPAGRDVRRRPRLQLVVALHARLDAEGEGHGPGGALPGSSDAPAEHVQLPPKTGLTASMRGSARSAATSSAAPAIEASLSNGSVPLGASRNW
jgi:hypothetical protein